MFSASDVGNTDNNGRNLRTVSILESKGLPTSLCHIIIDMAYWLQSDFICRSFCTVGSCTHVISFDDVYPPKLRDHGVRVPANEAELYKYIYALGHPLISWPGNSNMSRYR
jgi:hypothetical protein